jgi:SWI/SNF-related matrix-associated actin-dependent regulator of chromatin subfamily A3
MRRGRSYPLLLNFHCSILFDSIPFVRFDGRMSAKRRRDAINRFSVPLEREQSIPHRRSARNERPTTRDDDSCDSDSVVIVDDDDDFIDDDDEIFDKKSKRKGKGKAKDARSGSADGGENPRVMLLSLKAVCCFQIIKIS